MIPANTNSGVLPPFLGTTAAERAGVSPYLCTMLDVVRRFAISDERKEILIGLLDYRERLNGVGISQGLQWLAGSFLEDVEAIRGRPPKDIDVVTFTELPPPAQQAVIIQQIPWIIDNDEQKQLFHVDGYIVDLKDDPLKLVDHTAYWLGLFSHQRDSSLWKGLLAVPLQSDDAAARQEL